MPPNLETMTNQQSNSRITPNIAQNLGSRFQALAEIDLNINLENGMDKGMLQDSRDNTIPKYTNSNLDGEVRSNGTKSHPYKENIPEVISEGHPQAVPIELWPSTPSSPTVETTLT